ncbi:MAG: TolC family protein [Deltaproteobacteria bacterium]|nr:TolC family protein [Deltaproteobacteria bacterium]
MKSIRLFCLAVLSISAVCISDAEATVLSLRECVNRAIERSPELSSGRHLIEAAEANLKRTRGTTLPYFSSELQGYEINGSPVSSWVPLGLSQPENGPSNHQGNAHWAPVGLESFGVTYPLIYQGSILGLNDPPAVGMARTNTDQQMIANLITAQKVIFGVVTDYVYVSDYRAQVSTAEKMMELAAQQLEIVRAQMKLGLKLPQQVQVAEAQFAAANQARQTGSAGERAFSEDLANLIGQSGAEIELDGTELPLSELEPLKRFLDQVMAGHPALRAQRIKVEIARQQLRIDEANFWPTATLDSNFSSAQDLEYLNGGLRHPRPTAFLSYLTVSIPLYDFGVRSAAIDESRENVLSQKDGIEALDLQIRSEITQAYNDIAQYADTASQFQSNFVRDNQAALLAKAQYDVGAGDILTMTTAELTALQDKISIQLTEMAERLKYAELQNLSGGTWHWAP